MVTGRRQAGFTLVELMVVVAIAGVLATLAVAGYGRWIRKSRASEVVGQFAHMKMKQQGWYQERNAYLSTSPDQSEQNFLPRAPGGGLEGGDERTSWTVAAPSACPALGAPYTNYTGSAACLWALMGINGGAGDGGDSALYCQYVAVAGPAGTLPTTINAANVIGDEHWGGVAPAEDWFYTVARCDLDKDGVFSIYSSRGDQTGIAKENEGE